MKKKAKLYLKLSWRRLSNPIFFGLLLLSVVLWHMVKLGNTYTTDIDIPVRIDRTYYSVRCNVEGVGYNLLWYNIAPKRNLVSIQSDDVAISPSAITPGAYEISSFTLQNLISTKISDIKINSVESPVEIELPTEEEEEEK